MSIVREELLSFPPEERTSGVYVRSGAPLTAASAVDELREITGVEPVAVLLYASAGRPPEAAAYPPRPRRLDGGYSLTMRLSSWAHAFARGAAVDVPAYLIQWFPCRSVIVVPISTPHWDAGVLVIPRSAARHAEAIRSLACDLALRLELADRRSRLQALGGRR
jgi:hypothetical protein